MNIRKVDELKKHYVSHLFKDPTVSVLSKNCSDCNLHYTEKSDFLNHRAVAHTETFLIPEMEKLGLWTNAPYQINMDDINLTKARNVTVRVKNERTASAVKTNLNSQTPIQQQSKTRADDARSLICEQDQCSFKAENEHELKLHLLKQHFYDDITDKYKSQYQ